MKLRIVVALSVLCLVIPIFGQVQPPTRQYQIDRAALSLFPAPNFYMDVWFTDRLADANTFNESNISITTTPDHPLTISNAGLLLGTRKAIQVVFAGSPPTDVTDAKVCFHRLTFLDAQGKNHDASEVCTSVSVETTSTIASQKQQALDDLKKVPKTSQEKNIFASGFITTASNGSDGGANVNLNSNDLGIPGLTAFWHLDKTTSTGGDPKNFEAGMNLRNVLLFAKADVQKMQSDITRYRNASSADDAAKALADVKALEDKHHFWSAALIDFAGKLEGEAMNFKVANFVGDGQVQVQTRTQKLFGSTSGFWRLRIVPIGVEGGKNVSTTANTGGTPPSSPDYVARVKGGGDLTLFYENADNPFPFKRVDLNLGMVQRYLFFKEAEMRSTSNPVLAVNKGYRPWYQAALKVYMAESPKGKFGFQLTYQNGSLPPAFATTKAFQFGFLYETSDGEDKKPQ
ncbi:MAG: hypothetical protein ACLQBK_11860 [Candidatus Sulfotelmatobacter sp.]